MTPTPFFYAYLLIFSIVLFLEILAIKRRNTEQALALFVGLIWIMIGLMNSRVWMA